MIKVSTCFSIVLWHTSPWQGTKTKAADSRMSASHFLMRTEFGSWVRYFSRISASDKMLGPSPSILQVHWHEIQGRHQAPCWQHVLHQYLPPTQGLVQNAGSHIEILLVWVLGCCWRGYWGIGEAELYLLCSAIHGRLVCLRFQPPTPMLIPKSYLFAPDIYCQITL